MAGILVHTPPRDRIKAITRFLDPGLTGIFGLDDRLGRRQHGPVEDRSPGVGFVPRRRLAGLSLAPTDLPRRFGTGAQITGTGADLMMAMRDRTATLDSLAGPGLPTLRSRL